MTILSSQHYKNWDYNSAQQKKKAKKLKKNTTLTQKSNKKFAD